MENAYWGGAAAGKKLVVGLTCWFVSWKKITYCRVLLKYFPMQDMSEAVACWTGRDRVGSGWIRKIVMEWGGCTRRHHHQLQFIYDSYVIGKSNLYKIVM